MINPLNTNGFFLLVGCNTIGIVHRTYIVASGYKLKKNIVLFCQKIFVTLTNSVDPNELQQYLAFHQGLHCL